MQNKIETLNIKELEEIRKDYLSKIAEINKQITIKKNKMQAQLEQKRSPQVLSEEQTKERVNKYLHNTNYSDIPFLDFPNLVLSYVSITLSGFTPLQIFAAQKTSPI